MYQLHNTLIQIMLHNSWGARQDVRNLLRFCQAVLNLALCFTVDKYTDNNCVGIHSILDTSLQTHSYVRYIKASLENIQNFLAYLGRLAMMEQNF